MRALLQPACLLACIACVASFQVYTIPWASVSTSTVPKNVTGNCACDLTEFACDTGCCCDLYCAPTLVNLTKAQGRCLPSGTQETLDYCVPNPQVRRINLPANSDFYEMMVTTAENKFINQLLCIKSTSNPTLGDSYPDPPAGDVSDNQGLVGCPKPATHLVKPSYYRFSTPIYKSVGDKQLPLTVPYPLLSLDCHDQYAVGFSANIPVSNKDVYTSCTRPVFDLSQSRSLLPDLCGVNSSNPLSMKSLFNMSFYTMPSSTTPVPVTLGTIQYEHPSLGTHTPLAWNITTTFLNETCFNAIRYLTYTVYYTWDDGDPNNNPDGYGTVSKIVLSLIVTDVTVTTRAVKQSVRVQFISQVDEGKVVQSFSGNPGYLPGYHLLAGQRSRNNETNQQAVLRLVQGLPMPSASLDGSCAPGTYTPVRFGMNSTVSCHVPLNGYDLATFCTMYAATPNLFIQALLNDVYSSLVNGSALVGIWGNSNLTQTKEWIQVKVSNFPFNNLIYSATDRSCSNVVVGYDLQILTGVAFNTNNLQNKVLFANLCFRTATWDFADDQSSNATQLFQMTSTVTFISKEQVKESGVVRPAPPLLAPLPEEIFYPFLTSHSTVHKPPGPASLAALLIFNCALLLFLL